jgi:hypothetical protein
MRGMRTLSITGTLATALLTTSPAFADAVMPPPASCPHGYTPRASHRGSYCEPPLPTNCPQGQTPRVNYELAYCEPPPPRPCPPGAFWMSRSPTDTWCQAGWRCNVETMCYGGSPCVESSLCAHRVRSGRGPGYDVVSRECEINADCPTGDQCVREARCVPPPPPSTPSSTAPRAPGSTDSTTGRRVAVGLAAGLPLLLGVLFLVRRR